MKKLLLSLSLITFTAQAMEVDNNNLVDLEMKESPSDQVLLCKLDTQLASVLGEILKSGDFKKWKVNEGLDEPLTPKDRKALKKLYDTINETNDTLNRTIALLTTIDPFDTSQVDHFKSSLMMIPLQNSTEKNLDDFKQKINKIRTVSDVQIMGLDEGRQKMFNMAEKTYLSIEYSAKRSTQCCALIAMISFIAANAGLLALIALPSSQ